MFKTVCLQVVLLLGFVGCGGENNIKDSQDTDIGSSQTVTQPKGEATTTKVDALTISFREAIDKYSDRSKKINRTFFPWKGHDCSEPDTDTLEYLRLVTGAIEDHTDLKEKDLPAFDTNVYSGIRIYPFLKGVADGRPNDYLMVYTKPVNPGNSAGPQRDDRKTFRILKNRKINWCKLREVEYEAKSKLSMHFLCRPTCDPNDEPALNF